jgi:hypothetical protein
MTFIRDSHGQMSQRSGSRNSSLAPARARTEAARFPSHACGRARAPSGVVPIFSIHRRLLHRINDGAPGAYLDPHSQGRSRDGPNIVSIQFAPGTYSPRKATTQLQQNPQNADASTQQQTQQPPGLRDLGCTPQLGAPIYAPAGSGTGRHL